MLIAYPHGLGDLILLTPALRAESLKNGPVDIAMLKRFQGCGIFDDCPDVNRVFYLDDPWHGSTRAKVRSQAAAIAKKHRTPMIWIWHRPQWHKIPDCFVQMHLTVNDFPEAMLHTQVYISDEDQERAARHLLRQGIRSPFGFIHGRTGVKGHSDAAVKKDLPEDFGQRWLKAHHPELEDVVEVGVNWQHDELRLPVQVEIMRRAAAVCLADSVFYHARAALDQRIDFVYFGRGKDVHARVHPLHDVEENVHWTIPDLSSSVVQGRH